jgi:hypothetical protein
MPVTIGATIPEDGFTSAAMGLGLPLSTAKSGLFRAALALVCGKTKDEAREYASSIPRNRNLGTNGNFHATGVVPEDLLEAAELAMENADRAYIVRVGMGMAAGLSRKQAESWARMHRGSNRKENEVAA